MFSGTTQPFNVRTEPPGAQVIVNGSYLGVTPLNIQIARDKNLNVLLRAPGYPDKALLLHRDLNPVAVLNLLSIVCWAIDLATGAMFEIEPNVLAGPHRHRRPPRRARRRHRPRQPRRRPLPRQLLRGLRGRPPRERTPRRRDGRPHPGHPARPGAVQARALSRRPLAAWT